MLDVCWCVGPFLMELQSLAEPCLVPFCSHRLILNHYFGAFGVQWDNPPSPKPRYSVHAMQIRVGEGWDTHALVEGRPLILGGVRIEHNHGLLGHSDADALLHAITDALLGAAGLGDIGRHFPDADPQFKGLIPSCCFRRQRLVSELAGWDVGNVDSTIVAQAPKMAPTFPAMRERIAQALGVAAEAVNVKAKTAEKKIPVGEYKAIEARAICLLTQRPA